ncbi:hypothetical protein [Actinomadura keratinilytica]|uniref:Uncharacterized protein n=1 Tax=Actinomadura keratinilytica TaxID=547461 RepID=A0ABP7Z9E9_9ACTN
MRLVLLGIGAAGSPRFAPAGLLVEYGRTHVGFDGGPGSEPPETVQAWLVRRRDEAGHPRLCRIAADSGMPQPAVASFRHGALQVEPLPLPGDAPVGYRIAAGRRTAVWAPECRGLPLWAEDADLVFAGTSGMRQTVEAARRLSVRRLVFARLDEEACAAMDAGRDPPFGEWGVEGGRYRV